jgi:hypothetical protein
MLDNREQYLNLFPQHIIDRYNKWYKNMKKSGKRSRKFTVILTENVDKWSALRQKLKVDPGSDLDPDDFDSINDYYDAYFNAIDKHEQKMDDPIYRQEYIDKIKEFYVEWDKLGLHGSILFDAVPDPMELKIYHKTRQLLDEREYVWVRCFACGELFGAKKFSTTKYCSQDCIKAVRNEKRDAKKGIIRNEICGNPKCKKPIPAGKRADARSCSPACAQAIKRL